MEKEHTQQKHYALFLKILKERIQYSGDLNKTESDYFINILERSPDFFTKIHEEIYSIENKGVIIYHEIPCIVFFITNLFKFHIVEKSVTNVNIINLTKITLDAIFDSKLLPFPDIEVEIIKKIVDSSIDLLSLHVNTVKEEATVCFNMFKNCL